MSFSHTLSSAVERLRARLEAAADAEGPLVLSEPLAMGSQSWARWLSLQAGDEKLYWRARDGGRELAALGFAERLEGEVARRRLESLAAAEASGYFWISGFSPAGDGWPGYPQALLLRPTLALVREGERCRLEVRGPASTRASLLRRLRGLRFGRRSQDAALPPVRRRDLPDFAGWAANLEAARAAFAAGTLQKVVLARRTLLESDAPIPFWPLFLRWRQAARNSYQLAVQLDGQGGFVSLTPERLFERRGERLKTEALAGTLAPADSARHASPVSAVDAKNCHEHQLVVDDIRSKLVGCCDRFSGDAGVGLLNQPHFKHLYYALAGTLKPGVGDGELLAALHPTAAIGGLPGGAARDFIAAREPFPRGWYAGTFGPVAARYSELAVGIRSARVAGCRLELFAGAGIVPDSDTALEWRELEQKIALPLGLFPRVGPADAPSMESHVSSFA